MTFILSITVIWSSVYQATSSLSEAPTEPYRPALFDSVVIASTFESHDNPLEGLPTTRKEYLALLGLVSLPLVLCLVRQPSGIEAKASS